MNATIRSEDRDQPNLMELHRGVGLHFTLQPARFFAELITTDVTVQLDMPVPLYTVAGSF